MNKYLIFLIILQKDVQIIEMVGVKKIITLVKLPNINYLFILLCRLCMKMREGVVVDNYKNFTILIRKFSR